MHLQRVDEQTFFAVGSQACVGGECNAHFCAARDQIYYFHGKGLQPWQIPRPRSGDEYDIQVGAIINFRTAQLAETNDD